MTAAASESISKNPLYWHSKHTSIPTRRYRSFASVLRYRRLSSCASTILKVLVTACGPRASRPRAGPRGARDPRDRVCRGQRCKGGSALRRAAMQRAYKGAVGEKTSNKIDTILPVVRYGGSRGWLGQPDHCSSRPFRINRDNSFGKRRFLFASSASTGH